MKSKSISQRSGGLAAALFASLAVSAHADTVTIDGVRDNTGPEDYILLETQTTATNWTGPNQTVANCYAKQEGGTLFLQLAGKADGNAVFLFLDTKPGGVNFIKNNLITSGGEGEYINILGSSPTAGMKFESGFEADYAIRVYGAGSDAYVNIYDLSTGVRTYGGNSGATAISNGIISAMKTIWSSYAAVDYPTASLGIEMALPLAGLGVPEGTQNIKLTAMLLNGNSTYGSNQVLGSRPGPADMGGNMPAIDFGVEGGTQTLSFSVDNNDTDGDDIPNNIDDDDDGDGLLDVVESDSGTYVDEDDTGTDPLIADTDGDTYPDGDEVTASSELGYVSNPTIPNYFSMAVPGNYATPQWQANGDGGTIMTQGDFGSLTAQYEWTLEYKFTAVGPIEFKYAANGTFDKSWGNGGGNHTANIPATGFHTFSFNNGTLVQSVVRKVFADDSSFLAAYAVSSGVDDDGDGINNEVERTANTDPTNDDSDEDGLLDGVDPQPLVAAPQNRDVVFKVGMSVQIAKGNFNPATGTVVVKIFSGIMNGSPDLPMTDGDSDGVYETAPIPVTGDAGANFGNFKFYNSTPGAPNTGYETGADRTFVLGAGGVAQTVPDPVAFFSNDAALPQSYTEWSGATGYNLAPDDGRADDADDDGYSNLQEFLFGTPPDSGTGSLVTTTPGTGNVVLTWLQRTGVSGYSLLENTDLGAWSPSAVTPAVGDQTGVPAGYTRMQATVPTTGPKTFLRVQGVEF